MTVYVFADSHRYKNRMLDRIMSDRPDKVIFLGDVLSDIDGLTHLNIPVFSVCGNNDLCYNEETEKMLLIDKNKVFLTHGHRYNVRSGLSALLRHAKELGADVVLYAHTHRPNYEIINGIHIMNPGSVRDSGTFGKMEIGDGKVNISIVKL